MTAKKNAAVDPLAGIPTATASPVMAPKAPAAAPAGVINLASARKKRKLTGAAYKDAVKFARDMVGYDSTSPIWGRRLIDVLSDIESNLGDADQAIDDGRNGDARDFAQAANRLVIELKKRLAAGQIIKAQS